MYAGPDGVASGGSGVNASSYRGVSAVVTSPIGLSVLALSLLAAVRLHQWRGRSTQHAAGRSLASSSALPRAHAGFDDATPAPSVSTTPQPQTDKKKRSKLRRKRGKDYSNDPSAKHGQVGRASVHSKLDVPFSTQQASYASSSAYSPILTSSIEGPHKNYAGSIGSVSGAPSTLGDDLSSLDAYERSDPFDELESVLGIEQDENASSTTPVAAQARERRSVHSSPALASLHLPRLPLRPSKMAVRALNAYVDGLRMPRPSSLLSQSIPNQTITAPLDDNLLEGAALHHAYHSPALSNTTSSTTTKTVSVTSSSTASSQLSPKTPPAHIITSHSMPIHALLPAPAISANFIDEHGSKTTHDHLAPATTWKDVNDQSTAWLDSIETPVPKSGDMRVMPPPHELGDDRESSGPEAATTDDLVKDDPRQFLASSFSAPVSLQSVASTWDDSLDWGPVPAALRSGNVSGTPSDASDPASYSWSARSPSSATPPSSMAEERGRRSSNTHIVLGSMSAPLLSGSKRLGEGDKKEGGGENGDEGEDEEQPPAPLDILFPSLNDPPPSPYTHHQYDMGLSSSYPSDFGVGEETIQSLRQALGEARMREERWRAECARLAGEYERVRWTWTEEITRWARRESEVRRLHHTCLM